MSDAQIDAHLRAIRAALTPEESETARLMMEELAVDHPFAWVESLCRRSVPEGAAFLREKLAEVQRGARAREAAAPRNVYTPSGATHDAATTRPNHPRPIAPAQLRRDGRRAVGSPVSSASFPTTPTAPADSAPTAELTPVSYATQVHLNAIQNALTPAEDAALRAHLAALPMPERSAWISALVRLPVSEAVEQIRAQWSADGVSPSLARDERASAPVPVAIEPATRDSAAQPLAQVPMPTSAAEPAITDAARSPSPAPALALAAPMMPTAPTAETAATEPSAPSMPPAPVEISAQTHLLAIEQSLTAAERFLVHAKVAQMSPEVRESLLDQLVSSPVPEGAAILRAQIQDLMAQAAAHAMPVKAPPVVRSSPAVERTQDDDAVTERIEEHEDEEDIEEHEGEEDDAPDPDVLDDLAHDDEAAEPADPDHIVEPPTRARTSATAPSDILPMMSPEVLAQFQALDAALTLAERMRAAELAARLSPAELRRWITELTALPVSDALAKLRAALATAEDTASLGRKGGVS